jgi:hypothetical protein
VSPLDWDEGASEVDEWGLLAEVPHPATNTVIAKTAAGVLQRMKDLLES